LLCRSIKTISIPATDSPEIPGKRINRYKTPQTPMSDKMNNTPFTGESILNAAIIANKKKTNARLDKNICKDALSMLS